MIAIIGLLVLGYLASSFFALKKAQKLEDDEGPGYKFKVMEDIVDDIKLQGVSDVMKNGRLVWRKKS